MGVAGGGALGCLHPLARLQKDEEAARDKDLGVRTIGDVTRVANATGAPVSGVGLVVGLEGTGGGTPPGSFRTMLETELGKRKVQHVKELLASENNAMVLVSAVIPAGAHRGDPLDVEVTLPPGSKATSLRGGYLMECDLIDYDATKHLNPDFDGGNRLLKGKVRARARGPLLVGLGDGDEAAKQRRARIWGGGVSLIDRAFYLTLNDDQQFARISNAVAERINQTFRDDSRKRLLVLGQVTDRLGERFQAGGPGSDVTARAVNREVVYVRVPWEYRLNRGRYLRVARLIPLQDTPEVHTHYRRRLEERLLDPTQTMSAALRLEALGNESIPALKAGLKSAHVLVRFCAAESLAYLGSTAGAEELARLAEHQPRLRLYCLTALASLNETVCHSRLTELLASPSVETRVGAFRNLISMNERDEDLHGELLNESFWLHRLAPHSVPMVHLSSGHRAEVGLFGEDPALVPPFSLVASEFTLTASAHDDKCTIARFAMKRGAVQRVQCSFKLDEVVRAMAELGGGYPEVTEMLAQADRLQCLNCPVKVDAMPREYAVQELAHNATNPAYFEEDAGGVAKQEGEPPDSPETPSAAAGQPAGGADSNR
jgi:hypothetical protein